MRQVAKPTAHFCCHHWRLGGGLLLCPVIFPTRTHPLAAMQGPAANGQLVFLCGGDRDLFDRATKDLDLMGKVCAPSTPISRYKVDNIRREDRHKGISSFTEMTFRSRPYTSVPVRGCSILRAAPRSLLSVMKIVSVHCPRRLRVGWRHIPAAISRRVRRRSLLDLS